MSAKVNAQRVIVYGHGDATTVYSAAYTDEQVKTQTAQCAHDKGRNMGVRALDGNETWAEYEASREL